MPVGSVGASQEDDMLGIRFQVEREVVELDRRDARSGIEALRGRTGRCQQDRADAVDRLVLGIRIRIPLRHVQLQGRREVADRLEAEGREQLLRRQRDHLADGRRIAAGIRSVAETGERQARVSAARDIGECGGRCAPGDEQQGSCQNPPTKVSFFVVEPGRDAPAGIRDVPNPVPTLASIPSFETPCGATR
jgi:hypothetical protein